MTFNEKLVILRKINSLTQDEFAKSVGVSRQAVYKWECGQSYPEAMVLVKIKELFGISIDNLLDDSFEVEAPDRKKRVRKPKAAAEKSVVSEAEEIKAEKEEISEEKSHTEAIEEKAEKPEEKRKGFFGRLFGRK